MGDRYVYFYQTQSVLRIKYIWKDVTTWNIHWLYEKSNEAPFMNFFVLYKNNEKKLYLLAFHLI